jgi:hypothetical protein
MIKKIEQKKENLDQFDYFDDDYIWNPKVFVDYSYAIGEFIIEFNRLEHEMNIAIADIIYDDAHHKGYVIVEKLSFINKIDLFFKMYLGLVHETNSKHEAWLKEIRDILIDVNTFRNNIVHANWGTLTKDRFVRTKTVVDSQDGLVKFVKRQISPKTIEKYTRMINNIIDQINKFEEDI